MTARQQHDAAGPHSLDWPAGAGIDRESPLPKGRLRRLGAVARTARLGDGGG